MYYKYISPLLDKNKRTIANRTIQIMKWTDEYPNGK